MGNKNRRKVAISPQELERVAAAEHLKAQGASAFGSTVKGSFSQAQADQDMAEINNVANTLIQQQEPPPQTQQEPPQSSVDETQDKVQEDKKEKPKDDKLVLTGNPEEDCNSVYKQLKKIVPNPPVPQQLLQWKSMHGNIFLLDLSGHIYIYRYLKRQEWMQINADPSFEKMTDIQIEDHIFNKCVLWPAIDPVKAAMLPANTVGMLVQQIRIQSHFLDPSYVATLTIKI